MRSEIDWVCMGILLTPIALGIICVIGILIINCIEELEGKSDRNYITFESFISFYTINPDRWWTGRDDRVDYHISLHNWNNDVKLYFKPLDRRKYKRWKSEKYELAQKQKNIKEYQKVVECVQRDLEEFNRKNEQMIKVETEKYKERVGDIVDTKFGKFIVMGDGSYVSANLDNWRGKL